MTRDEQEKRLRELAETGRNITNPASDAKYGGVVPCPKCGMMTYPGRKHDCPMSRLAVTLTEAAFAAAMPPEKDKSLIWDDCPSCAYKHLTAAYAALTSLGGGACWVPAAGVYAARAEIAIRESRTGYPGNMALAIGCLAMAEIECEDTGMANAYRDLRLELTEGRRPTVGLSPSRAEAYAAAHLTEALRELPALADRINVCGLISGSDFNYDNPSEVKELLRTNIKWLADTYELNKGTNA